MFYKLLNKKRLRYKTLQFKENPDVIDFFTLVSYRKYLNMRWTIVGCHNSVIGINFSAQQNIKRSAQT